jgi:deoxyribodipyrimidine photo-lyase
MQIPTLNPDDAIRVRCVVDREIRADCDFVLYWMTTARRARWNFGLQRAMHWALELVKPLVVLEALRVDYHYASDRLHGFVFDGMRANERAFAATDVLYWPYVERAVGEGKGLLSALTARASVIVTDDYPCFFLPRMLVRAGRDLPTRLEAIDSNGLLPLKSGERVFSRAVDFRRFLQRVLPVHLASMPAENPLADIALPKLTQLPIDIAHRWPRADEILHAGSSASLVSLPIDHAVSLVDIEGGADAGERALERFITRRLAGYADTRNDVEVDATSGLSPYLHFGHVGAHQVFARIATDEDWTLEKCGLKATGNREGWWGLRASTEAFLDQLITWRELGFNACAHSEDYDTYESLPAWARATLDEHARDARAERYSHAQFEEAATHDPLWNAAQNQLRRSGTIHNYLRMLWGKKILQWSESPRAALATMIELNNKYALDGRDPNSYTGILWTLGKYDRPWGPARPIFGTVRYMSSDSTRRKMKVDAYIKHWNDLGSPAVDAGHQENLF